MRDCVVMGLRTKIAECFHVKKKTFRKKGENACYKHFGLFQYCFRQCFQNAFPVL